MERWEWWVERWRVMGREVGSDGWRGGSDG